MKRALAILFLVLGGSAFASDYDKALISELNMSTTQYAAWKRAVAEERVATGNEISRSRQVTIFNRIKDTIRLVSNDKAETKSDVKTDVKSDVKTETKTKTKTTVKINKKKAPPPKDDDDGDDEPVADSTPVKSVPVKAAKAKGNGKLPYTVGRPSAAGDTKPVLGVTYAGYWVLMGYNDQGGPKWLFVEDGKKRVFSKGFLDLSDDPYDGPDFRRVKVDGDGDDDDDLAIPPPPRSDAGPLGNYGNNWDSFAGNGNFPPSYNAPFYDPPFYDPPYYTPPSYGAPTYDPPYYEPPTYNSPSWEDGEVVNGGNGNGNGKGKNGITIKIENNNTNENKNKNGNKNGNSSKDGIGKGGKGHWKGGKSGNCDKLGKACKSGKGNQDKLGKVCKSGKGNQDKLGKACKSGKGNQDKLGKACKLGKKNGRDWKNLARGDFKSQKKTNPVKMTKRDNGKKNWQPKNNWTAKQMQGKMKGSKVGMMQGKRNNGKRG